MTAWECDFCGETVTTLESAEDHMKDEHTDDIASEEWARYYQEVSA